MLNDLLFRMRSLLRRQKVESELEEELRFHLDREGEKYQTSGVSEEEAIRRARLALGGTAQVAEACRDARGLAWLETRWKELCYALRTLRVHPLFTVTVVASLALGIGVNIAIFTLLRASLWKPLAIAKPGEMFHVQRIIPGNDSENEPGYSYVLFQQLSRAAQPYGEVLATARFYSSKFGMNGESREHVVGEAVSANFFSVLRLRPYAGRFFESNDDNVLGGRRVAILSYGFWTRRFQANPSILGKDVLYKETPYTVIGIVQPGFDGVEAEASVDLWVPIASDVPKEWLTSADTNWLRLLARLRPESKRRQVEAALDACFRSHLLREILPGVPQHFRSLIEPQHLRLRAAAAGLSTTGRRYERPLLILMTVAALVLLICCANVANLTMAHNRARQAEITVRRALGASRGRIVSQLFIESLVLTLFGTCAALVLATWMCRLLIFLLPPTDTPLAFDVHPDFTVLGFAAGIGFAAAVLLGLFPALWISQVEDASSIKRGARATARSLPGQILVVGQLALSLVLLIGAGLFLDTIRNLNATDLGFRPQQVMVFDVSFPKGTSKERLPLMYEGIRDRLQQSPGVVAASYAWPDVYDRGGWSGGIEAEGHPASPGEDIEAGLIAAGPNFFETLRLGLLRGRYLTQRDLTSSLPVAVVNESLARYYFGNANPIGRRIKFPGQPATMREIVGVVRDAKHYGVREKAWRMVYIPAFQEAGSFLVRTIADQQALSGSIRSAVSSVDRSAQIEHILPLQGAVDKLASRERLVALLSTVFGGLALVLASIGLYGVMAYSVARRTAELGIRIALGAQSLDVQWMVLKETIRLTVAGISIGITTGLALTRFVSSILYGVQPNDAGIFFGAGIVLAAVAAMAGFVPARRASRIDPIAALRCL